jgi:tRNA(Ile)-lysidine synthase
MNLELPRVGTYVIAVSGGVDSIALLHALQNQPGYKLVVAHFDHGIREDSASDRAFVQEQAKRYGLPFVYKEGDLGVSASEADARAARYEFLRQVQAASGARALVTAHHQDDVLETAIINILRGTGRKGLTALRTREGLVRPLLDIPKRDLIAFAKSEGLNWREDSTNQNLDYLRNYVRHRIVPRFDEDTRNRLWQVINDLRFTNEELDRLLTSQLHLQSKGGMLDRTYFTQLPYNVSREVMATWLRAHGIANFDGKTLERLVVAAKTGGSGRRYDVLGGVSMLVEGNYLALVGVER